MAVSISSNAARILKRLDRLPPAVQKGVEDGMKRGLLLTESAVRLKTDITPRRGNAGLMGRLTSDVVRFPNLGVDGVIGFRKTSGFPYELSQEFGAKAKPGKAMAIPVSKEARQARSPRDMEGLALIKDRTENRAFLVRRWGKQGNFTKVHWVLVKRIKPRLRFRENVDKMIPVISDEIVDGAKTKVKKDV